MRIVRWPWQLEKPEKLSQEIFENNGKVEEFVKNMLKNSVLRNSRIVGQKPSGYFQHRQVGWSCHNDVKNLSK